MVPNNHTRRSASRALQALALLSLARRIGFRRGRRLALLAATGYVDERRKRNRHR